MYQKCSISMKLIFSVTPIPTATYLSTLMAVRFRMDAVQDRTSEATQASQRMSLSNHIWVTCQIQKDQIEKTKETCFHLRQPLSAIKSTGSRYISVLCRFFGGGGGWGCRYRIRQYSWHILEQGKDFNMFVTDISFSLTQKRKADVYDQGRQY